MNAFDGKNKMDKEELKESLEILGTLFGMAGASAAKAEPEKKNSDYESFASDMKEIYDAFIKAGFDKDQAFVLLNTFIEGAAAGFKR